MSLEPEWIGMPSQRGRLALQVIAVILVTGLALSQSTSQWSENLRSTGVLLILIGVAGRIWSMLHLGGRKFSRLIVGGPYWVCRNPLYMFSLLAVLGAGLQSGSILFAVVSAFSFFAVIAHSVLREETALQLRFGAAYALYCERVPRFWPRLSAWKAGEEAPAPLRMVVRTALERCAFFLLVPAEFLFARLQDKGALPVILKLSF